MNKAMDEAINSIREKDNEIINKLIKDTLQRIFPKIKGKITAKKLKLLGITIGITKGGSEYWVMRRGVQISPILKIVRKVDKLNHKITTKYEFYNKNKIKNV